MSTQPPPEHSPIAARIAVIRERVADKRLHLRQIGEKPLDTQMRQRLNETLSSRQIAALEHELALLEQPDIDGDLVPVAVAAEQHGLTSPQLLRLGRTGELHPTKKYLSNYLERREVEILTRYGGARLVEMSRQLVPTVVAAVIESLQARDFDAALLHCRRVGRRGNYRLETLLEAALTLTHFDAHPDPRVRWFCGREHYTVGNLRSAVEKRQRPDDADRHPWIYNPFDDIDIPLLRSVLGQIELTTAEASEIKALAFKPTAAESALRRKTLSEIRAERLNVVSEAAEQLAAKPSNKQARAALIRALDAAGYGRHMAELVEEVVLGLTPLGPSARHDS